MESINISASSEAGELVQSIWPDATWAKVEMSAVQQQMTIDLGRGTAGPVLSLRTVGLDGNVSRLWNATQTYEGDNHHWLSKKDIHPEAELQKLRPERAAFDKVMKLRKLLRQDSTYIFHRAI